MEGFFYFIYSLPIMADQVEKAIKALRLDSLDSN